MNEDLERNIGRSGSPGTSNRDDRSDQDEGNPMVALARFSKKLAPWYRTIITLVVGLGSLNTTYDKIMDKIKEHDKAILQTVSDDFSKKTTIPFYQIDEHSDSIATLESRMDVLYDYINIPYKNKAKKKVRTNE